MRPQPRKVFRSDAAARLDDIELVTALLERDATNGRSRTAERGFALPPLRRRRKYPTVRRAVVASAASLSGVRKVADGVGNAMLHPRLFSGARVTARYIADVLIMLVILAGPLAAVAVAFLIAAPPV